MTGFVLLRLTEQHLLHQVPEQGSLGSLERLQQIMIPLQGERRQMHAHPPALQVCVHTLDVLLRKPKIHHIAQKGGHFLAGGTQLLGA